MHMMLMFTQLKSRNIMFLVVFFWLILPIEAQIVGTPFVRNFERSDYQGGFQTWSIAQGDNGMMYFGNNNGLLEYDGINWILYPLPNSSIVRALCKGKDHVLFSGGFNEIGYFELGKMGGVTFKSLLSLVPEESRDFGEIWKIFMHSDGVIFQSFSQLMFYKDNEIKIIKAPSSFHFSFLVNGEYYVNDLEKGLMRYSMGELFPLVGMERLKGLELWSVLPFENKLMIATASKGIYLYDGNSLKEWACETNTLLKPQQIYSAIRLSENELAFGTIQNGLLISDRTGKPLQELNWRDGLQNNTILCIHKDQFNNLWLGTDHGIDYVEINSSLTRLSYNYGLSTGYTAIFREGNLYLGTNQGLFITRWNVPDHELSHSRPFKIINETQGQVWTLNEIGGALFCGHNSGTFIIEKDRATKISDVAGGWTYLEIPSQNNKVIGGTYSGLILFEKINGQWTFSKRVPGFSESSRSLAIDTDGSIWMAHGMKGVFHLWLNEQYDSIIQFDFYNSQNSPLNDYAVNMAQTNLGILFNSGVNTFRYDKVKKSFESMPQFESYMNGLSISSLKEDDQGDLWYFDNSRAGVLRRQEDGTFNKIDLPFRRLEGSFVNGFEFVYPYHEGNVIFGTENGFVHYNPSLNKSYAYPFKAYIRTIHTFYPDTILHVDSSLLEKPVVLNYSNNGADFSFSANDFENSDKILFSTRLEGYEIKWSEWQSRPSREFTNLEEGNYIFSVKAKNTYGTVTKPVSVEFRVLPPWKRTITAYIIYLLFVVGLLVMLAWWIKKRVEKTKLHTQLQQEELFRKREEVLQRETLEAEKKVIKMRNEKLREEMVIKDKELANATMQTLHKNKTMINIKNELNKISSSFDTQQKYHIQLLIRKINKEIDNENQWKVFETHFENVHEAFLTRIKLAFPILTPRELKLCAYLRMNISSKEISVLMNISTRGVEISRYRLRKKFNLGREENLTDFILSF